MDTLTHVFGVPVITSPFVPPDQILVVDGKIVLTQERLDKIMLSLEIRTIVRSGIKKAHPWLRIPRAPRFGEA